MSNHSRVQAGVPQGGQFAAQAHTESAVALTDAQSAGEQDRDWGEVSVREGSRTPWGLADWVDHPAPGIASVSTPGHGGLKLSPERNRAIPSALRNRSGWYEEDCESHIVGMYHPEAFAHRRDGDHDSIRADSAASVKDWFPDQYQAATGEAVGPEESHTLRRRQAAENAAQFRAAHAQEFVSTGWGTDSNGDWVPDGYRVLSARMDSTGEEREFLVPKAEAVADHRVRDNVIIDPHRHIDVTGIGRIGNPPPKQVGPAITGEGLGVRFNHLTADQASRAEAELGRRWRFRDDDGTERVESLAEHFARVGVAGKKTVAYGGETKTSYVVE